MFQDFRLMRTLLASVERKQELSMTVATSAYFCEPNPFICTLASEAVEPDVARYVMTDVEGSPAYYE
jgi:hypothetical protein